MQFTGQQNTDLPPVSTALTCNLITVPEATESEAMEKIENAEERWKYLRQTSCSLNQQLAESLRLRQTLVQWITKPYDCRRFLC